MATARFTKVMLPQTQQLDFFVERMAKVTKRNHQKLISSLARTQELARMYETMLVVGTRPEIIKMAPVVRALQNHSIPFLLVHCGQHYDFNIPQQFTNELNLPKPDHSFKVQTSSPNHPNSQNHLHPRKTLQKNQA